MANITEKRVLPYTIWHDRDGGACMNDAHDRLVAMFGYHPDGTPAMDEAKECMVAVNFHERLKDALTDMQQIAYMDDWPLASTGRQILYESVEKLIAEILKAGE